MVKNGTFASPAMARASSVLPVPGGPTSSTPFGILPPRRWNFCGSLRNSTISSSSSFASSMPATSSKVMRPTFSVSKPGAALAEAHGPAAAALHLAHEEDPDADQQQHREPLDESLHEPGHGLFRRLHLEADVLLLELGIEARVVFRRVGDGFGPPLLGLVGDHPVLDGGIVDLAAIDLLDEIGIGDRATRPAVRRLLEDIKECDQQDDNDNPEREILAEVVHGPGLSVPSPMRSLEGR